MYLSCTLFDLTVLSLSVRFKTHDARFKTLASWTNSTTLSRARPMASPEAESGRIPHVKAERVLLFDPEAVEAVLLEARPVRQDRRFIMRA